MTLKTDETLGVIVEDIHRYLLPGSALSDLDLSLSVAGNELIIATNGHHDVIALPARIDDIAAAIKRVCSNNEHAMHIGQGWTLDPHIHSIRQASSGITIPLNDKESQLLTRLINANGEAISKEQLLSELWNYADSTDSNTVETHVYRLRQKLKPIAEELILTTPTGYVWETENP